MLNEIQTESEYDDDIDVEDLREQRAAAACRHRRRMNHVATVRIPLMQIANVNKVLARGLNRVLGEQDSLAQLGEEAQLGATALLEVWEQFARLPERFRQQIIDAGISQSYG